MWKGEVCEEKGKMVCVGRGEGVCVWGGGRCKCVGRGKVYVCGKGEGACVWKERVTMYTYVHRGNGFMCGGKGWRGCVEDVKGMRV